MKNKLKFILILSILLPLFLLLSNGFAFSKEIKWYSYEDGAALRKKAKKNIFIHFYADWCGYCKKMGRETFKNPEVISYLNKNFISIFINSDKDKKIVSEYRVRGFPANWFVSKNGEKIGNLPGFIKAKRLLLFLKYIHSDSYRKMTLEAFENSIKK